MGKKRRLEKISGGSTSTIAEAEDNNKERSKNAESSKATTGDRSSSSSEELPPTRTTDRLYASSVTFDCTMNNGCVPCAYKIGCFDVALDKEFCKATPNQRPEQCPRSRRKEQMDSENGVMGFRPGMSILTVGDGDFSFSLGLARKLMQKETKEKGKKTFLVATSYESESTLRKVYPDFDETLREMDELGVHVAYNVDATRILETLSLTGKASSKNLERRFHRICWNFPCTAIASGQDGQNTAMEENKDLVRNFVESSRSVLTDKGDGELYVCHKTKPPYNQWNLEEVALQKQKPDKNDTEGSKVRPLLYYSGRIVLDRFLLPPYTPRKALDKKSFPCHDACFYIFAQEPTSDDQPSATKKKRRFVSTIPHGRNDGAENSIDSTTTAASHPPSYTMLVKIEPELIHRIRQNHMKKKGFGKKRKHNNAKPKMKNSFNVRRF